MLTWWITNVAAQQAAAPRLNLREEWDGVGVDCNGERGQINACDGS